mgnify:CR=1 FL=1
MFLMLKSPLEQFEILSVLSVYLWGFDLSVTNSSLVSGFSLSCFLFALNLLLVDRRYLNVVPPYWSAIFEDIYNLIVNLITDTTGIKGSNFSRLCYPCFALSW